jgi:hypothetical protein
MKKSIIFKSTLLLMLFAGTIFILNSCIKGKGGIVEQQITVTDDFTGVKAMSEFNVVVVLGSAKTVIAKGNQNIIDRLITNVNNDGILELELEPGNYREFELTVYISIPFATYLGTSSEGDLTVVQSEGLQLDSLNIVMSGNGNIKGLGDFLINGLTKIKNTGSGDLTMNFTCGQLSAEHSGEGDLNLDYEAGESTMKLSGAGNFNLTGFSPTQHITHSGTGDYRAFYVYSSLTDANLSNSGNIECRVSSQLNATLSGSGDILYKGSPAITSNVTGSGSIRNAN